MNVIDRKFEILTNIIKNKSVDDVFFDIKNKYNNIDKNIKVSLEDFFNKFPYWGSLNESKNNYDELYNRANSLVNHIDDFIWLYDRLGDYRSKKILFAIISNWYNFDFDSLRYCYEANYLHYFDLDLVDCDSNEVIVDLGAYTGDTIIDYFNSYGSDNYKKIYCYEIGRNSFYKLNDNLKNYPNIIFRNVAICDKPCKLFFTKSLVDDSANTVSNSGDISIDATCLDCDIKDKISLLKMDIEGSEVDAIKGAREHIINEHPKMLISVYHNHEDIWKIPKMINEMVKDYNFYLRYYGNNIFPTEIVLIAIYKNMNI